MQLVIIGGEAAGMSAAAKARRLAPDVQITVFEMSGIISFGACGLPYFVGGEFDDPGYMAEFTPDDFAKRNIQVHTRHQVLQVKPEAKQVVVKNLDTQAIFTAPYDRLLVATGASAIRPPITGLDLPGVYTLNNMSDGLALKTAAAKARQITVIGGGFIGLEVVESLVALGKSVRLIQLADRVMPEVFDPEITRLMEQALRKHQVALHLLENVNLLQGSPAVHTVHTDKGQYATDLVVVCAGVRPNTAFLADLNLQQLANGAVIVNAYGQSSLPDIYAAGDCATVPHLLTNEPFYSPLATVANKLGRWLGENLVGERRPFPGTLGSAAIRVFNLEAGRTGLSEAQALAAGFPAKSILIQDKNHANYIAGQSEIHVKITYEADSKRLLGAQMIGESGAVHRIDALAVAISKGVTAQELGMIDFCYAPPFARAWDVLNVAGNVVK